MAATKKKTSGPSGPTHTKEQRREAGLVRLDMWLPLELVERLDAMRGDRSRRVAIEVTLRAALGLEAV